MEDSETPYLVTAVLSVVGCRCGCVIDRFKQSTNDDVAWSKAKRAWRQGDEVEWC
jgi:hypothetical protein